MSELMARRRFLALLPGAIAGLATMRPRRALARSLALSGAGGVHPEPRPGIDASRVLTAEDLAEAPDVIPIYDGIREIPYIADGIHCYCGCADLPGYRSLLTCYEEGGMAVYCEICQGHGRLAHRRWKEGQSLDQIRRAIDARFSHGTDA